MTAWRSVAFLEEDPDLAGDLEGARLAEATRRCLATAFVVAEKEWHPEDEARQARDGFGLLVLDGVLIRRVGLPGRFGAELLGPGDLLRPWQTGEDTSLPFTVHFAVAEPARIAILDRAFGIRAALFPEVATAIAGRAMRRVRNLAVVMAIVHPPEVYRRLLLVLWYLADRWGQVTPEGARIPLRLRHQLLADLVAAGRPSVTSALTELTNEGLVRRDRRGLLMETLIPADQLTSHESVVDEARVGRFSRGLEGAQLPPSALHRGRVSEGLELLADTPDKRRPAASATVCASVRALRAPSAAGASPSASGATPTS